MVRERFCGRPGQKLEENGREIVKEMGERNLNEMESEMKRGNETEKRKMEDWGERRKSENEKTKSENRGRDIGRERFRREGRLREAGREEEMRNWRLLGSERWGREGRLEGVRDRVREKERCGWRGEKRKVEIREKRKDGNERMTKIWEWQNEDWN